MNRLVSTAALAAALITTIPLAALADDQCASQSASAESTAAPALQSTQIQQIGLPVPTYGPNDPALAGGA